MGWRVIFGLRSLALGWKLGLHFEELSTFWQCIMALILGYNWRKIRVSTYPQFNLMATWKWQLVALKTVYSILVPSYLSNNAGCISANSPHCAIYNSQQQTVVERNLVVLQDDNLTKMETCRSGGTMQQLELSESKHSVLLISTRGISWTRSICSWTEEWLKEKI